MLFLSVNLLTYLSANFLQTAVRLKDYDLEHDKLTALPASHLPQTKGKILKSQTTSNPIVEYFKDFLTSIFHGGA